MSFCVKMCSVLSLQWRKRNDGTLFGPFSFRLKIENFFLEFVELRRDTRFSALALCAAVKIGGVDGGN